MQGKIDLRQFFVPRDLLPQFTASRNQSRAKSV